MAMFDTVTPVNISHESFDSRHNRLHFQTKCLTQTMSHYLIFNRALYLQYDGEDDVRPADATPSAFSGVLNIYTTIEDKDYDIWIEYDLTFDAGKLIDISPYEPRIQNDKRDLSVYRPALPSNRATVSIRINDLSSEQQDLFVEDIQKKVDAIRNIIGFDATISYPYKESASKDYPRILPGNGICYLHSVVQRMSDFDAKPKKLNVQVPSRDNISVPD